MNDFFAFAVHFATGCVGVALALASVRLFAGPAAQDRVLALDNFTLNALVVLLLQALRTGSTVYFDLALLLALFGFLGSFALARFLLRQEVIEP